MSRKRVLTLDKDSESIDSTKYRGMIGSLLYLTASRSNIMFSVYFCARFQEDPKISHLEAVKRIFRYIKGTQHLVRFGVKEPLSPNLNEDEYSICCENTTYMMNTINEARMESREMLLSIHYSLNMLLDIISKMNRKLEDEKIKMNDKGKEKVNGI
ncbi:hypothetical protein Tco_1030312 [Tanacetum coccineum]|uniref:Reverse transcriptase Ty1/copia-type domain-containing protein n=1 Tax=Tanacetum coccineum TaxID=301880 RepID=A0ABQ5G5V8_9ASTR